MYNGFILIEYIWILQDVWQFQIFAKFILKNNYSISFVHIMFKKKKVLNKNQ